MLYDSALLILVRCQSFPSLSQMLRYTLFFWHPFTTRSPLVARLFLFSKTDSIIISYFSFSTPPAHSSRDYLAPLVYILLAHKKSSYPPSTKLDTFNSCRSKKFDEKKNPPSPQIILIVWCLHIQIHIQYTPWKSSMNRK